jgi:hypothetical protein
VQAAAPLERISAVVEQVSEQVIIKSGCNVANVQSAAFRCCAESMPVSGMMPRLIQRPERRNSSKTQFPPLVEKMEHGAEMGLERRPAWENGFRL